MEVGFVSMMDLPQIGFLEGLEGMDFHKRNLRKPYHLGPSKSWKQILDLRGVVGVAKMVITMAISPTYPPKFN